jgi:hypothetical protein
MSRHMSKQVTKKLLVGLGASTLLLLVFAGYLQPEVVMTLANQIWFCF